jgi:predicted  nucleic acid-binding Zn-ribbon protein
MEEQHKRNRDFEQRITNLTNRVWGVEKEIRELKERVSKLENTKMEA